MPGVGNGSPVINGGKLFVCVAPATLVCVNVADGKILWQRSNELTDIRPPSEAAQIKAAQAQTAALEKELGQLANDIKQLKTKLQDSPNDADLKAKLSDAEQKQAADQRELEPLRAAWYYLPFTHPTNGYASFTPVTDGSRVFAVFGTGVVAAYDLSGKRLWARMLDKPKIMWGASTSPIIVAGKLIVHLQSATAVDPATGRIIWQTPLQPSYGTPAAAKIGGVDVIVTSAGDIVRVADGVVLAKGVSKLDYASPLLDKDIVYFIQNGGKAIKLPAAITGDTAATTALWETKPRNDRYYASPIIHEGLIYAITQANWFSCIDAATGAVVYEKLLNLGKGTCYPSVTFAGGLLFASNDNGATIVIKPGREYQEVAANSLEPFRGSPVFIGDRLYIHGQQNLYCLRASKAK